MVGLLLAIMHFSKRENKTLMDLLDSDDWPTLVETSLNLGGSLELSAFPPAIESPENQNDAPLDSTELVGHEKGGLPYLGQFFKKVELTPLNFEIDLREYPSTGRILSVDNQLFCVFTDGQRKMGVLFNRDGERLDTLPSGFNLVQSYGQHILVKSKDQLTLFKVKNGSFEKILDLNLTEPITYLQERAILAQTSTNFFCSDFQFEIIGNEITIWAFNVSTTAFLPDFLHIQISGNLDDGILNTVNSFGLPTLADRLPVPGRAFATLRKDNHFWVPRLHDPQIDVFSKNGALVRTIEVNALPYPIYSGDPLSSSMVVETAIEYTDPNEFFRVYNRAPMISGVYDLEGQVSVTRLNLSSNNYSKVYTLVTTKGNVSLPTASGTDFFFQGSSKDGALFLTRFRAIQTHFPAWLRKSRNLSLEKIKEHENHYWLARVKI